MFEKRSRHCWKNILQHDVLKILFIFQLLEFKLQSDLIFWLLPLIVTSANLLMPSPTPFWTLQRYWPSSSALLFSINNEPFSYILKLNGKWNGMRWGHCRYGTLQKALLIKLLIFSPIFFPCFLNIYESTVGIIRITLAPWNNRLWMPWCMTMKSNRIT